MRRSFSLGLLVILLSCAPQALAQDSAETVTVYPADYFSGLNVITARDMLSRIPGSEARSSQRRGRGRDNRRGLRDQADTVLVDGKRIVGKSSEAEEFLGRLPAAKVERIEVVDGMVTETEAEAGSRTINIITTGDGSGSGNWGTSLRWVDGLGGATGGHVSYNRSLEATDFSVGVEIDPRNYVGLQEDVEYLEGVPLEREVENRIRDADQFKLQGTARITLSERSTLRLNAAFDKNPRPGNDFAETFEYGPAGEQVLTEYFFEPTDRTEQTWEIGGSFEHRFSADRRFELLFLRNEAEHDRESRRTTFEADDRLIEQEHETRDEKSEETVVRGTWYSRRDSGSELDLGVELAVNTLGKATVLFEGEPEPL
ncbi:MAG: TonB-dependent receptor plug domain-containing protein, partial [Xanthomonadales bacterium]|nr:TonB-dependent receptor plug domain-containing protein [Xanthomonadales bacterium]NIX13024.1 TonB-dependent receptor plug domain-containing protein [Xanthomonadales bacterium]